MIIYTKENCTYCDKAKALLESMGIEYEARDIKNVLHLQFLRANFFDTVPQIYTPTGEHIGGFTELKVWVENDWPAKISAVLIDKMGGDLSVVNSARVSFAKESAELNDNDEKLIKYLARERHTTPFRHVELAFRCKAPIFLARQLGKHQTGMSWNEVSRRYVNTTPVFFNFDFLRKAPEKSIKQGSGGIHPHSKDLQAHIDLAHGDALDLYDALLYDGVAPEQARAILPQSMITEWIWTGSLLAFFHLWRERNHENAQKEAQDFATWIDFYCGQVAPIAWQALKTHC